MAKRRTNTGNTRKGPTKAEREFISEAEEILEQMRGIADSAHVLNISVEESSSTILELGA